MGTLTAVSTFALAAGDSGPDDMFPGHQPGSPTQDEVETEIEAHGFSIVELTKAPAPSSDIGSPFNRRVTGSKAHAITGPLRGHAMMQTSTDPAGETVLGCLNNCAGGKTPGAPSSPARRTSLVPRLCLGTGSWRLCRRPTWINGVTGSTPSFRWEFRRLEQRRGPGSSASEPDRCEAK